MVQTSPHFITKVRWSKFWIEMSIYNCCSFSLHRIWFNFMYISCRQEVNIPKNYQWTNNSELCKCVFDPILGIICYRQAKKQGNGSFVWGQKCWFPYPLWYQLFIEICLCHVNHHSKTPIHNFCIVNYNHNTIHLFCKI